MCINRNVQNEVKNLIKTRKKKLSDLTRKYTTTIYF